MTAPRLNIALRIDEELLTGEARDPQGPAGRGPLLPNAKAWLQACASAARLLEDNGSSALFESSPLAISIGSPRAAAARFSGGFGAAVLSSVARLLGPARPGPDAFGTHPTLAVSAAGHEIRLPAITDHFDPAVGLLATAPFWSQAEAALYTVVHEAGHAAHFKRLGQGERLWGCEGAPGLAGLFCAMGMLGDGGDYGRACMDVFQESYADCFAALAMGGSDASEVARRAEEISTFRALNIPDSLAAYAHGDFEHDTREALGELAAWMAREESAPFGARVEEACMICAQIGTLRWAQSVAATPAGAPATLMWRRASSLANDPANSDSKAALESEFEPLRQEALGTALWASAASDMGESDANRAALALGLKMALLMRSQAGEPRASLRGLSPKPPR